MPSLARVAPISSTECLVSETENSTSELSVANDDQPVAVTHCIDDTEGWVLPESGVCDFLPTKKLSKIEVLTSDDTQRLFRAIYRQPRDKADLCITWGESKGAGVVVWSCFCSKKLGIILPSGKIVQKMPKRAKFDETTGRPRYCFRVPVERTMDPRLHDKMGRNIKKACRNASGRLRALGFTRVVEGEPSYKEMGWQIRLQPDDDADAESTTLKSSVPL
ncbi:hypothetical protein MY11210_003893 [Beauveria gryllotalpidicola]